MRICMLVLLLSIFAAVSHAMTVDAIHIKAGNGYVTLSHDTVQQVYTRSDVAYIMRAIGAYLGAWDPLFELWVVRPAKIMFLVWFDRNGNATEVITSNMEVTE